MVFSNNGERCTAGSRILVQKSIYADFVDRFAARAKRISVGDPLDEKTLVGPMISPQHLAKVRSYIELGPKEGATLVAGGLDAPALPAALAKGNFVQPTVFADVRNDMTIARDEIFGPVLAVIGYRDEEDAIAIANDTVYGLQAYVSSTNPARARAVAARLQAGRVQINGLHHEPLAPFGGFKQSGLGREFGEFGLEAFLEAKSVLGAA